MPTFESTLALARHKLGEATNKYGFPARLGWKSTDSTTILGETPGLGKRYRVRLGVNGEMRVITAPTKKGIPDVYDLVVRVAFQDGTLVMVGFDETAPLLSNPWGGGTGVECEQGPVGLNPISWTYPYATGYTVSTGQTSQDHYFAKLTATKYAVTWFDRSTSTGRVYARVINVLPDGTVTFGAVANLGQIYQQSPGAHPTVARLSDTKFVVAPMLGTGLGIPRYAICTVGVGDAITSTVGNIHGSTVTSIDRGMIASTDTHVMWIQRTAGAVQTLSYKVGTWNGTAITWPAAFTTAATDGIPNGESSYTGLTGSRFFGIFYTNTNWIQRIAIDGTNRTVSYVAPTVVSTFRTRYVGNNKVLVNRATSTGGGATHFADLLTYTTHVSTTYNTVTLVAVSPNASLYILGALDVLSSGTEAWVLTSNYLYSAAGLYRDYLTRVDISGTTPTIIAQFVSPDNVSYFHEGQGYFVEDDKLFYAIRTAPNLQGFVTIGSNTPPVAAECVDDLQLSVSVAVTLPNVGSAPSAPVGGSMIYAIGNVARVVDSLGARNL